MDEVVKELKYRLCHLTKQQDSIIKEEENISKAMKKLEEGKEKEEEKQIETEKEKEGAASTKKTNKPKIDKKKVKQKGDQKNDSILETITAEIKKQEEKLNEITSNKEKIESKTKLVRENITIFANILKGKNSLQFDLVNQHGERADLSSKGYLYVNSYLVDKQCYELNKVNTNEKGESILEPLKVDGFCFRSLEEDIKYEENEKTNKAGKKPKKK